MSRFLITNLASLAGIGVTFLLPPDMRLLAGSCVAGLWVFLLVRGVTSLRVGFFLQSVCEAPQGSDAQPAVALTFDDGPDPETTPALLELLEQRGVRAAFFVVGKRVEESPELARRCHEAGHLVENHSHHHAPWINFLFRRAMTHEILACSQRIEAATGSAPRYYRPPYGLSNHALGDAVHEAGLKVVGWQVRGLDSRGADPERIVARILGGVRAGGIVLLHDGGRPRDQVLSTVGRLLDELGERCIAVKRLDELLNDRAVPENRRALGA